MSASSPEDAEFCWRSVLEHDPWFRLHYNFVPQVVASRVVALHALFAMLERSLSLSEESLRLSQLAWWQSELLPTQAQTSAHPVVRTLRESGALDALGEHHLAPIFRQVLERLNKPSIADENELESVCSRIGGARFAAERALGVRNSSDSPSRLCCAGAGLSLLVQSALQNVEGAFWFIPLDWQARYRCNTRAVCADSDAGRSLRAAIRRRIRSWYSNQFTELGSLHAACKAEVGVQRHLIAWAASDRLKVMKLLDGLGGNSGTQLSRWGLTELMQVWWACVRKAG